MTREMEFPAAADTPAAGESVRETSALSGSPGASLAGLSEAAFAGVTPGSASAPMAACGGGGSLGSSSDTYAHSNAPFFQAYA